MLLRVFPQVIRVPFCVDLISWSAASLRVRIEGSRLDLILCFRDP